METATIEETIVAMERKGWRVSNLSHLAGPRQYSCILERDKTGQDGFKVYAASALLPTAREAVADAWANAQKPIDNSRVFQKIEARPKTEKLLPLEEVLREKVGLRVRLEDALEDLIKVLEGREDEEEYL